MVVIFFVGLVASWSVLTPRLPFPEVPGVQEKLEQLGQHGDEYDALFIGSSRVWFQVMPSIFDRIVRDEGMPLSSFNAAVGAMVSPEDDYVIEQYLRQPHRRLRWVFLELTGLSANSNPTLAGTRRLNYWHDWRRTGLLTERCFHDCAATCRSADQGAIPWSGAVGTCAQSVDVWVDNLWLFLENSSSYGRGEPWLTRRFGWAEKRKDASTERGRKWDGWAYPRVPRPWTEYAKRRTEYEEATASLMRAPEQRFEPGDAVSWKSLHAKLEAIIQAGATPILIVPPTVSPTRYYPPELAGGLVVVLDFSNPREHPELFQLDHRLDGQHLNYDGATIFTEEIARQFVEVAKRQRETAASAGAAR
jgi:hypothetical protein